jgi:hypothetical protein
MGFAILDVDDKADTTRIMLVARVVEPLCIRQSAHLHFASLSPPRNPLENRGKIRESAHGPGTNAPCPITWCAISQAAFIRHSVRFAKSADT